MPCTNPFSFAKPTVEFSGPMASVSIIRTKTVQSAKDKNKSAGARKLFFFIIKTYLFVFGKFPFHSIQGQI
jgi:hypothetical protein